MLNCFSVKIKTILGKIKQNINKYQNVVTTNSAKLLLCAHRRAVNNSVSFFFWIEHVPVWTVAIAITMTITYRLQLTVCKLNLQHWRSVKQRTDHLLCPWHFRSMTFHQIREMVWFYICKFFRIRTNLNTAELYIRNANVCGRSFQHYIILCLNNEIIGNYITKSTSGTDLHLFFHSSNFNGSLESKQV